MLTDIGANIGDSLVPVAAMGPRRQVDKITFSQYSRHTVDTVDTQSIQAIQSIESRQSIRSIVVTEKILTIDRHMYARSIARMKVLFSKQTKKSEGLSYVQIGPGIKI